MIYTLIDACEYILELSGESMSSYWIAFQAVEMKLWRTSEAEVQVALVKDIEKWDEKSQFIRLGDDEFALRKWTTGKD